MKQIITYEQGSTDHYTVYLFLNYKVFVIRTYTHIICFDISMVTRTGVTPTFSVFLKHVPQHSVVSVDSSHGNTPAESE